MFIRKNCSFAKSIHLQKLFIHKNCLFVKTVHSHMCQTAKNDVTHLFSVDSLHFLHIRRSTKHICTKFGAENLFVNADKRSMYSIKFGC